MIGLWNVLFYSINLGKGRGGLGIILLFLALYSLFLFLPVLLAWNRRVRSGLGSHHYRREAGTPCIPDTKGEEESSSAPG